MRHYCVHNRTWYHNRYCKQTWLGEGVVCFKDHRWLMVGLTDCGWAATAATPPLPLHHQQIHGHPDTRNLVERQQRRALKPTCQALVAPLAPRAV